MNIWFRLFTSFVSFDKSVCSRVLTFIARLNTYILTNTLDAPFAAADAWHKERRTSQTLGSEDIKI